MQPLYLTSQRFSSSRALFLLLQLLSQLLQQCQRLVQFTFQIAVKQNTIDLVFQGRDLCPPSFQFSFFGLQMTSQFIGLLRVLRHSVQVVGVQVLG